MIYHTKAFPQDRYRFKLYDNAKGLTWQQIQAAEGCCALMPLAYFVLTTFAVDSAVMIDGKWLKSPQWHEFGVCIDKDGHITVGTETDAVCDYAVALPPKLYNGQDYAPTQNFARNGCTAIGFKADGTPVFLLCGKSSHMVSVYDAKKKAYVNEEVVDNGLTSAEMVAALKAEGCVHVLRYDGSWTSQGTLGDGMTVQPAQKRIARNYILVFERETDEGGAEDMVDTNITKRYLTKNRCYTNPEVVTLRRMMLHSTGTPGASAASIAAGWDSASAEVSAHFAIDDTGIYQLLPLTYKAWHGYYGTKGSANGTCVGVEICEPVQTALLPVNWLAITPTMTAAIKASPRMVYQITRLQMELMRLGYDPKGVDGSYGPGCQAAVRAYQAANKLTADGSVGQATLASLQSRTGSLLRYQVADAQAYFGKVYGYAVQLAAWLMGEIGGKVSEIIDHSEGHKQGIASNHADVMHWFPQHGKSMDTFRADVAALAGMVADPFAVAVDKLTAAGVITNSAYWLAGQYSAENVKALILKMANAI